MQETISLASIANILSQICFDKKKNLSSKKIYIAIREYESKNENALTILKKNVIKLTFFAIKCS
jgi:hypothetical protein